MSGDGEASPVVKPLLITIDGPAGAGKSTVSKALAQRLGYRWLDTGALYRGVALAAEKADVNPDDEGALAALCRRIGLELVEIDNTTRLLLDRADVTDLIRAPNISALASAVSARPAVRAFLLNIQRAIGAQKRVVVEGRDMGTIVFPDADLKFFLYADLAVRAGRRFHELGAGGTPSLLSDVEEEMRRRDTNDTTRAVAPLRPAIDAIRIDSSCLSVEGVVDLMLGYIHAKAWSA